MIQRLVRDLDMPVRIEVCPTVREPDGLAMSSRNAPPRRADERARATALTGRSRRSTPRSPPASDDARRRSRARAAPS